MVKVAPALHKTTTKLSATMRVLLFISFIDLVHLALPEERHVVQLHPEESHRRVRRPGLPVRHLPVVPHLCRRHCFAVARVVAIFVR